MIGASREVIEHHIKQHPCGNVAALNLFCPCRITVVLVCQGCGENVFAAVKPKRWCVHATQLTTGEPPTGVWTKTTPEEAIGDLGGEND